MAYTYQILGQLLPAANTYGTLYTVPAGKSTIASTLNVCNLNSSNVGFRIACRQGGAALTNAQFIAYDIALGAQDAIGLTLGMTLTASDVVTVYSYQGNVAFNLFGTEIT
jgi:hypothetical protein